MFCRKNNSRLLNGFDVGADKLRFNSVLSAWLGDYSGVVTNNVIIRACRRKFHKRDGFRIKPLRILLEGFKLHLLSIKQISKKSEIYFNKLQNFHALDFRLQAYLVKSFLSTRAHSTKMLVFFRRAPARAFVCAQARMNSSNAVDGPLIHYKKLVASKRLTLDPAQVAALGPLQRLHEELVGYEPESVTDATLGVAGAALPKKSGPGLFATVTNFFASAVDARNSNQRYDPATRTWSSAVTAEDEALKHEVAEKRRKAVAAAREGMPQGIYMVGGVGCGKTMLMDMFCDRAPVKMKRRVHFHAFMLEVHNRIHELRKGGLEGDPIPTVVQGIRDECVLLCFDEFQVNDVADALIMRRLFSMLMDDHGVVVVATSNRPPDDLYHNGIQRDLFLPFIDHLKRACELHDMASQTDFRLLGTDSKALYLLPGPDREDRLEALFHKLTKGGVTKAASLTSQGRLVKAPRVSENGVARFTFAELCLEPRGAADYLALSKAFHTFFVTDIPQLDPLKDVNPTRRFITLIDTLYEARVKLVASAEAEPAQLLHSGDTSDGVGADRMNLKGDLLGTAEYVPFQKDEAFAFDRTVSRLVEMQSVEYLTASHRQDGDSSARQLETLEKAIFTRTDSGSVVVSAETTSVSEGLLRELWESYDIDLDNVLSRAELQCLLEDLSFLRVGHRNVDISMVDAAFDAIDIDGDNELQFEEFRRFSDEFGLTKLTQWVPSGSSAGSE